jgi:hypothetical protein
MDAKQILLAQKLNDALESLRDLQVAINKFSGHSNFSAELEQARAILENSENIETEFFDFYTWLEYQN